MSSPQEFNGIRVPGIQMRPTENDTVKVKETGNVLELMWLQKKNNKISIQKLNDEQYMLLATGEVKEFIKQKSRADNIGTVKRSLSTLRDLLNCNCTNVNNCRWVTLTYKENMTDTKRLYVDFKKFIMRLRYNIGNFEYIVAMEPQGRGAWHCHVVMVFDHKAPYIPNNELAECWGNGYVKIKKLDDVDNVGAYLTAYLGDMEVQEVEKCKIELDGIHTIKTVKVDNNGEKKTKKFIKGARMVMYPPKFNLYRCSRGVKRPNITYMKNKNAEKKVNSAKLTFEQTICLSDEKKDFSSFINYRYYNKHRK